MYKYIIYFHGTSEYQAIWADNLTEAYNLAYFYYSDIEKVVLANFQN